MQVLPVNTIQLPSTASMSSVGSVSSSSRDIASSTLSPSVTVSLSNSDKAEAITNITVPPVYTRVSVGATTVNQLSPSRNSVEGVVKDTSEQGDIQNVDAEGQVIVSGESEEEAQGPNAGVSQNDETRQTKSPEQAQGQESNAQVGGLSEEELKLVDALQQRDREVRAHEQAHKSVGGSLAGAVSFSYQAGPNGKRYAVGGEVPIDASSVPGDPAATIVKMNTVKAAATAPVDPSAQDQSVAASASRVLAQARKELAAQGIENMRSETSETNEKSTSNEAGSSSTFKSEYEDVIAPLETKSIEIDEMV